MHYQRWRHYGDPLIVQHVRPWDGTCKVCRSPKDVIKSARLCLEHHRIKPRQYRKDNLDKIRKFSRKSATKANRRVRAEAIAHYGGVCACCGEVNFVFLVIDHVGGGGNAHRRSLTASGKMASSATVYRWLKRKNWPPGFQVLCHNCNFAAANGGCPHKKTLCAS